MVAVGGSSFFKQCTMATLHLRFVSGQALSVDPSNTRALFRRGCAYANVLELNGQVNLAKDMGNSDDSTQNGTDFCAVVRLLSRTRN